MKMTVRSSRALAVLLKLSGALLLGSLCGSCVPAEAPKAPDPCNVQIVTLNVYAGEGINPTEEALPRPVVVRLYQLTNDMRMVDAKYDDILLRASQVLEKDVIQVDEVQVFPNDLVKVKFERNPEASVLAGVALFLDPQGHSWKTYYNFPPMPNTPEACSGQAGAEDPAAPQAFPETAFFLRERKIDDGSQYDESMFARSEPMRSINLPKRSATTDDYAGRSQAKR